MISLWFRVPQETIDKAKEAHSNGKLVNDAFVYPIFNDVIPLVVMGKSGKSGTWSKTSEMVDGFKESMWNYDPVPEPLTELNVVGSFLAPETFPNGTTLDVLHEVIDQVTLPYATGAGSFTDFVSPQQLSVETTAEDEVDINPTVIGVICGRDPPQLYVNLQTGIMPEIKGAALEHSTTGGSLIHAPSKQITTHNIFEMKYPVGVGIPVNEADEAPQTKAARENEAYQNVDHTPSTDAGLKPTIHEWKDISDIIFHNSANFSNWDRSGGAGPGDNEEEGEGGEEGGEKEVPQSIKPDHWHHVLISFEIKPCIAHGHDPVPGETSTDTENWLPSEDVESTSKLWIALDDKNFTKFDLSSNWNEGGDPNEVLTEEAFEVIGKPTFDATKLDNAVLSNTGATKVFPTFEADCRKISGAPVGLPASQQYQDNVLRVEMAEFQLFTGITLDTGDETKRRGFIDAAGKPVDPNKSSKSDGLPGSIELLKKRPDILLHQSSNWKNGKNTGTSGKTDDGNEIPEGQFQPTAKIENYKPDPSLHGPQNPGEK